MSIESTQDITSVAAATTTLDTAGGLKRGSSAAGQDGYSLLVKGAAASSPMFSGYVYNPEGLNLNNATNSNQSQNRPNGFPGMVAPGGEAATTQNASYGNPGTFREMPNDEGTLLGSIAKSIGDGTTIQGNNSWEGFRNVFDGILIGGGYNSKTRSLNQVQDSGTSGYTFKGYQYDHQYSGNLGDTIVEPADIDKTGLRNISGFRLGTDVENVGAQISEADATTRYVGADTGEDTDEDTGDFSGS